MSASYSVYVRILKNYGGDTGPYTVIDINEQYSESDYQRLIDDIDKLGAEIRKQVNL